MGKLKQNKAEYLLKVTELISEKVRIRLALETWSFPRESMCPCVYLLSTSTSEFTIHLVSEEGLHVTVR